MNRPFIGHGVGLRVPHYERALAGRLDVDWVEVITENFFGGGGRPRAVLEAVRREVPLVLHGVSLGVGSRDGAGDSYLQKVKALADAFEPAWVSDHLCWTRSGDCFAHELLPLPYTEEALDVVVRNVARAQEHLRRPLVLENVSSYVGFLASRIPEWEFLSEVAARSGCFILLDLNNVIVSARNHGFAPLEYLHGIDGSRVWQFHLANHTELPTHHFDDHRGPVPQAVWALYEAALERFGAVSSLVEWDEEVPSWEELRAEQREAAARSGQVLGRAPSVPSAPPERIASAPPRGARAPATRAVDLDATQRLFFRALTWPTGTRGFLDADEAARSEIERVFTSDVSFDRVQRLDVYANAYFYRLLGVLRELFPRLSYLAGEACFHDLVTDYVLQHPSTEPDLRRLGERLPGFIEGHELGGRWPVLREVSLLERALARALDGADGAAISEADLARVLPEHWPELRFTFSPTTECFEARFDLVVLGDLCDRGEREAALALPSAASAQSVLVGRRGHRVYFRSLEGAEARALARLMAGASFAEACEHLLEGDPDFSPASLVSYLRRWLSDGAIAGFSR